MLCFERQVGDTHYSVRRAGASVRLYSNGVFHTQWNPDRPFAGGVWDCLSLPALYLPSGTPRRVLVLGVGGGAVIRQLQTLLEIDELTGVELDPWHVTIARRWFEVDGAGIRLVVDDAVQWLARYRGPPFDVVIDDLFGHVDGETARSVPLDPAWIAALARVTDPAGVLVVNTVGGRQLKQALPPMAAAGLRSGYHWSVAGYANAVGVLFSQPVESTAWLRHLQALGLNAAILRSARRPRRRALRFG